MVGAGRSAASPCRFELPDTADRFDRARRYMAKVPGAISGCGGHARTFLAAQRLVHGFELDDGQALELLAEWSQTCSPPWSEAELAHKVAQAREHGTAIARGLHLGVSHV